MRAAIDDWATFTITIDLGILVEEELRTTIDDLELKGISTLGDFARVIATRLKGEANSEKQSLDVLQKVVFKWAREQERAPAKEIHGLHLDVRIVEALDPDRWSPERISEWA